MIRGLAGWLICAAIVSLAACGSGPLVGPTAAPVDSVSTLAPAPEATPDDPADGPPATPTVVVALTVQPGTVAVGETAEVRLSIDGVVDLYGAEIHLRFDPTLLEAVDASGSADGVRIEAGGIMTVGFTVINAVDNAAGSAAYAVAQMPPSKAVTGSGDLLQFWVRAKAAGTATVQVESIILASVKGAAIPHTVDVAGAALVIQ